MHKFYQQIIDKYLQRFQNREIAMPGHNGPYYQKETFVRNTSHWLVTYSIMYKCTQQEKYAKIISRFAKTLCNAVENSAYGVICCIPQNRSSTNGLIGLAWAVEGLVAAYSALKNPQYLEDAEKIFFSQPYNHSLHTWIVVNTEGERLGPDVAFNHSLWFCMAAAKLVAEDKNIEIENKIQDYLEHVDEQFTIYNTGLISHYVVHTGNWVIDLKRRIRKHICAITRHGIPGMNWKIVEYERAYHLYSLYAFAWLYYFYPQAKFFKSKKFNRLKAYGLNMENFLSFPEMNSYAYGYNSPAYELPFAHYIFKTGKDERCAEFTLTLHKKYNITSDGVSYTENVPDAVTLDARIYEAVQYYMLKEKQCEHEE